jgi:hypothetical protein
MELLDICITTKYLQSEDIFYQKVDGMAMRSSLSPPVSSRSIFVGKSEEIALDTADHKPARHLRPVDDTLEVWPRASATLQQFLIPCVLLVLVSEDKD